MADNSQLEKPAPQAGFFRPYEANIPIFLVFDAICIIKQLHFSF
jgi:hypothetical protein